MAPTTVSYVGETRRAMLDGFECGPVAMEFTAASVPGTGGLVLITRRGVGTYALGPLPTDTPGRAFRLVKVGGGSDVELERADVLLAADGSAECNCKGRQRWGRCKHVSACVAIVANDWLPEPRLYRDEV